MIFCGTTILKLGQIQSKRFSYNIVQKTKKGRMASSSMPLWSCEHTVSNGDSAMADLGIESTEVNTAPGVTLDETEKILTCSVFDVSGA